ncbi:MAG: carbohydrate kinase [Ardenticatenaceae bacterium]|nr:carbohydrate kinase [Ardenticatenaceae bacterium]
MTKSFLLGVDQGTSGSRALILDDAGQVRGYAYRPLTRLYSRPDWVEQDPQAVAEGVAEAIAEAIGRAGCRPDEIAACGLTSQRNTDFVWDARTGQPLANAITWQDLRTLPLLDELATWPPAGETRHRLGYAPGPYMSALHLAWRMRHDPAVAAAAQAGHLRLGLSTAWLLTALGHPAGHQMDTSLVQAMGLYDFRAGAYWADWLDWLGVPAGPLPAAVPTIHHFGTLRVSDPAGASADVPVLAMLGDQQSALFGHGCRYPGAAECTHGTASFVKVFLGERAPSQERINVYYAWHLGQQQTYCLEAPTTVTGAAIRWMRDNARLFDEYSEMDQLAASVPDAGGVVYVPAFTGLEVPYNDPKARATMLGLTLGHHRGHIARAFFESIGYQIRAILETIMTEADVTVDRLLVGGGVSASDLACQIQADLLGIPILRPTFTETTAWAAGLLAGLGAGFWATPADLPPLPGSHTQFDPPGRGSEQRDRGYEHWQQAVALVQQWGDRARA